MEKLWEKFDQLTEVCYKSALDAKCKEWDEAYEVFCEIIKKGRESDPAFAEDIVDLDDDTDFVYGVRDWVEDYLDELDEREEHRKVLEICQELLKSFAWKREYSGDMKFRMASAMAAAGEKEECLKFCQNWYEDEQTSAAATALVYAYISLKNLESAEEIIKKFISEETVCTEENNILFIAASDLYQISKKDAEFMQISKALEEYEQGLLTDLEDDDDILFELPFE